MLINKAILAVLLSATSAVAQNSGGGTTADGTAECPPQRDCDQVVEIFTDVPDEYCVPLALLSANVTFGSPDDICVPLKALVPSGYQLRLQQ